MFKFYKDLCDVVSVLVYCAAEKTYLLNKSASGEFWLPSSRAEKKSWKLSAQKLQFEVFGLDSSPCIPLRVYKLWLPAHPSSCCYHVVYKVPVSPDTKRKTRIKQSIRCRLQWCTMVEIERMLAHATLRSPEIVMFAHLAVGDLAKDFENFDMEMGNLIELCEDSVIVGTDCGGGGAVAAVLPQSQLLTAAGFTSADQIHMYREFLLMVYPCLYMSPHVFTQFMMDIGFEKVQCPSLFRSADLSGRGGLSFLELLLWAAALEPSTQHSGIPAEIRCRFIFRYFDVNRDHKLEYTEFKGLVAATRAARQLPIDSLSVSRDADVCLRQLGLQPNTQLPLTEFLRAIGEMRLRGTSSLLRAPRGIASYVTDLHAREKQTLATGTYKDAEAQGSSGSVSEDAAGVQSPVSAGRYSEVRRVLPVRKIEYNIAQYTLRYHSKDLPEMTELISFDEETVSSSTTKLILVPKRSYEVLGPSTVPAEALAAVHYFATSCEKTSKRGDTVPATTKPAYSWFSQSEEAELGALLIKLCDAVRPICAAEPRLLRLPEPAYCIGDLHGNLEALLTMERSLWPAGGGLTPAKLLFLGDYVDRGLHGTELMAYLLASKLQRPHGVVLIRGNHETRDIQKMFTFHTECVAKYGESEGGRVWTAVNNVFDVLPLAAIVDDKIFCCHGGIPPPWVCPLVTSIDKVPNPLPKPAEQSSIAWELLWNDPIKPNKMTATLALELAANEGFAANAKRGTGHVFDQTALDRFLLANQLSHVVRAHEVYQNGFMCQLKGKLISVFSSSHYCGGSNESGVALVEGGKVRLIRVE